VCAAWPIMLRILLTMAPTTSSRKSYVLSLECTCVLLRACCFVRAASCVARTLSRGRLLAWCLKLPLRQFSYTPNLKLCFRFLFLIAFSLINLLLAVAFDILLWKEVECEI
jgi:hypothetical protein